MKDRIIKESISSLRREGLRFSVDTLAERLCISKKTIYKFFQDKELLAFAMNIINEFLYASEWRIRDDKIAFLKHVIMCLPLI